MGISSVVQGDLAFGYLGALLWRKAHFLPLSEFHAMEWEVTERFLMGEWPGQIWIVKKSLQVTHGVWRRNLEPEFSPFFSASPYFHTSKLLPLLFPIPKMLVFTRQQVWLHDVAYAIGVSFSWNSPEIGGPGIVWQIYSMRAPNNQTPSSYLLWHPVLLLSSWSKMIWHHNHILINKMEEVGRGVDKNIPSSFYGWVA